MATIDLPTTAAFRGAAFSLSLDVSESAFEGFYTGNRQRSSNLADRLRGMLTLPPCRGADAGPREAFIFGLRSAGDRLRMGMPHRPTAAGTLSGSPVVSANAAAGARSVTLGNARASGNLLRRAQLVTGTLATGWSLTNATITPNAVTAPDGTTTAWTLNRTATGNHFGFFVATISSPSLRTVQFSIWLKAGTMTGDVALRIRDGSGVSDLASTVVTPTADWQLFRVSGTFGAGVAADVNCYIDPVVDTGSAGQTLQAWYSEVVLASGFDTLCTSQLDYSSPPAGYAGASELVRRTAAGNAYSAWVESTSANANRTYTGSVWLKAGTFSGSVTVFVRDGSGGGTGATTVTLTAAWQLVTFTITFGAAPAADVVLFIDQADGGSIDETFERYGAKIKLGGADTAYAPLPTSVGGDFISIGGNLLQVAYAGATGDSAGTITLPLSMPLPKALTAGAVVTTSGPTGLWEWDADSPQFDYSPGLIQAGFALPLRQVVV